MLNPNEILNNITINQEGIKTISSIITKSSLKIFIDHPFISSGIILLILLSIGTLLSIFLDRAEGNSQELVWNITIYVIVFFVTFLLLVFIDTAEVLVLNKI